jgi:hypothetical protein
MVDAFTIDDNVGAVFALLEAECGAHIQLIFKAGFLRMAQH